MSCLSVSEGGYVNHPKDPGKGTNRGVTQATYDAYRTKKHVAKRDIRLITDAEVADIYRTLYADPIRYDDLPAGVDYATFDAAVNSGVSRGAKWLQSSLGVTSDGKVGDGTVAAAAKADAIKTVKAICSKRLSFLRGLGTFSTFGKGWTSRVARVEAEGVSMAMQARGISKASLPIALSLESRRASEDSAVTNGVAKATGTAATGSAASTAVSNLSDTQLILMAVAAAALAGLAVYLIHRSRIHRERAAAYASLAEGASE
nr:glycosyl hydrolase 108 family protein [Gellertiella hungarica]